MGMQSINMVPDLFTLYDKTVYLPFFNVNIISYFPCFRIVLSIRLMAVAIIVFVVKFSLVPREFPYYLSYIISKPLNYTDKEKIVQLKLSMVHSYYKYYNQNYL